MNNSYNQTLLTFDQEEQIIRSVLGLTGGWFPKFYDFHPSTSTAQLLHSLGLQSTRVYLGISGRIELQRKYVSHQYQKIVIDVSKHKVGNPNCDHIFVQLYWEVGGGGLDSGVPHSYIICSKCAHARERQISPVLGIVRSLWSKVLRRPVL
jgi:hypothetical protein